MPTYEYVCKYCGHELEELQSIKEAPLTRCPECNQETLARVMGAGSGLIFKGSGFYLTDYVKNEGKRNTSSTPKADAKTEGAPATTTSDQKPPPPSTSSDTKKE